MRRRALRLSFVVSVALGAAAMASGCSNKNPTAAPGCPGELPAQGARCDLPLSLVCGYATCAEDSQQTAQCVRGTWNLGSCNPSAPVYEAGPDGDDAGPHVNEAGPDVVEAGPAHDAGPDVRHGGPDGESEDAGHVPDATGDVGLDAESE